ncbi:hypothetical protein CEXT_700621 [Caerostris extrusa]|uniref:Uncharacterized protein n=1 Tax=Caerostris extrusa TaxID=172846 RepID=A0AAV4XAI6_CAEEX|nr:hypothetical protein CEXT_700621 [Caerostris extrusa]
MQFHQSSVLKFRWGISGCWQTHRKPAQEALFRSGIHWPIVLQGTLTTPNAPCNPIRKEHLHNGSMMTVNFGNQCSYNRNRIKRYC